MNFYSPECVEGVLSKVAALKKWLHASLVSNTRCDICLLAADTYPKIAAP